MKNPFYQKIKEDSDKDIGMDWDAEDSEAEEERKKRRKTLENQRT